MRQAFHYKNSEGLHMLHEGDTVRMKLFQLGEKKLGKAIVNKRLDDRSYEVETNSGTYGGNSLLTKETPPDIRQRPHQPSDDRTARRDDPRTARRDDPTSREDVNESAALSEPTSPARCVAKKLRTGNGKHQNTIWKSRKSTIKF